MYICLITQHMYTIIVLKVYQKYHVSDCYKVGKIPGIFTLLQ